MTEINNGPEALKGEDWAGEMGAKWLANLACFEGMIAPIGEALLRQADFKPGERVLDIGCGGGGTTIAIAKAVAPSGEVVGIDISPDLTTASMRRNHWIGRRDSNPRPQPWQVIGRQQYIDIQQQLWTFANSFMLRLQKLALRPDGINAFRNGR